MRAIQKGWHFRVAITSVGILISSFGEGTFEFLSNPRGAWVEVDGERVPGRTPLKLTTASGPHVIRMGQEERHIVEETHTLKHAEKLEVNFNLHRSLTVPHPRVRPAP